MGKFDGILICSDWDETFNGKNTIPVNSEAVKYFTDNGGKFTFITGRGAIRTRELTDLNIHNVPVGIHNGSVVYDFFNNRLLTEKRLDIVLKDFIELIYDFRDTLTMIIVSDNPMGENMIYEDITYIPPEVLGIKPIKILCVTDTVENAESLKKFILNNELMKNCYISRSWNVGIEITANNATKGDAMDFIKTHLGNIHTTIGIGNYENDVPLIEHADIGVAVGDAIDEVKKAADITVKPCNEFAIKNLIEILDEKYTIKQK